MDRASSSKVEVGRQASMTRRVAHGGVSGYGVDGLVGINLLSTLSQALDNIDRYNNEYSRDAQDDRGGGESDVETIGAVRLSSSGINGGLNNDNVHNNTTAGKSPHHLHHPRKPISPPPSQFSSYLKFNKVTIRSLLAFVLCYALVLICCYPMVYYSSIDVLPTDDDYANGGRHHIKRGSSFEHVRGRKQFIRAKHALGKLKENAVRWEEMAKVEAERRAKALHEAERDVIDSVMAGTIGRRDGEDAVKAGMLLERAVKDFEDERTAIEAEEEKRKVARGNGGGGGHDHWKDALEAWDTEINAALPVDPIDPVKTRGAKEGKKTPGFMVLGMHRSGTSMLSGLLVKGFGYETGGPLIGASFDNEKGFYERIDVVLQNDEFMQAQRSGWSWNVLDYDPEKALEHKSQGTITFEEGKTALKFLNNHQKTLPYLQKDPRMCITLPTWLKLLDDEPAIVFTYRHPLEVAMSLKHREEGFTMEHGLRLWIAYNMRALQYSRGLCRVFSTNEAVLNDPSREVQRIKDELTTKCNVIPPPTVEIPIEVVNAFVDPKLQHNKKGTETGNDKRKVLKDFRNGCLALDFKSEYEDKSANRRAEIEMYLMAMQVFCDMENGVAYEEGYVWPDLVHWQRPARIN